MLTKHFVATTLLVLSSTYITSHAQTISPEEMKKRIESIFPPTGPRTNTTATNPTTYVNIVGCPAGSECTPLHLCSPNGTIIVDGSTGFTERNANPQCPSLEKCCSFSEKSTGTDGIVTPRPNPEGCGFRNEDGVGYRVVNAGEVSQYGEFPWVVAIMEKEVAVMGDEERTRIRLICGGSLITPSIVITAAHCVHKRDVSSLIIRAGEYDPQTLAEILPHQDREVVDVVIHPDFSRPSLRYDIAVLELDEPIQLQEHIQPICLPPTTIKFDNNRCVAFGWGKELYGADGVFQNIPRVVELPVIPRDTCQSILRNTPQLGKRFELHDTFLCAGGELAKDTCKGDGGSPLMCEIPGQGGRYYLSGMVSWGVGCGDPIPAGYVNVPYLRSWIDEQLRKKNAQASYYTP